MTRKEFWQRYKTYERNPSQPLAVLLTNGSRVYIDKPEQVTPDYEVVTITRWQNPNRPESYRYDDITRLVLMTELPADPDGMSYAEFNDRMSELLVADPFEPFVIELKNGERVELDERRGTTRAGRFIRIWDGVGQPVGINFDQVARLTRKALTPAGR